MSETVTETLGDEVELRIDRDRFLCSNTILRVVDYFYLELLHRTHSRPLGIPAEIRQTSAVTCRICRSPVDKANETVTYQQREWTFHRECLRYRAGIPPAMNRGPCPFDFRESYWRQYIWRYDLKRQSRSRSLTREELRISWRLIPCICGERGNTEVFNPDTIYKSTCLKDVFPENVDKTRKISTLIVLHLIDRWIWSMNLSQFISQFIAARSSSDLIDYAVCLARSISDIAHDRATEFPTGSKMNVWAECILPGLLAWRDRSEDPNSICVDEVKTRVLSRLTRFSEVDPLLLYAHCVVGSFSAHRKTYDEIVAIYRVILKEENDDMKLDLYSLIRYCDNNLRHNQNDVVAKLVSACGLVRRNVARRCLSRQVEPLTIRDGT